MTLEKLRERIIDRKSHEEEFIKEFAHDDLNSYGAGFDTGFSRALQLVLNTIDNEDDDEKEQL